MRHFLRPALISTALALVLSAGPACADEVSDFTVNARVGNTGNLTVEESILVDFGKNQRHGLLRKIPTYFASDNAELEVLAAESPPGTNCHKVVSQLNQSLQLKLGDPRALISGKHTYRLKYIIKNPAKKSGDSYTYEWSPNGKNWHMPIKTMTVNITGATAGISKSLAVTRQDSLPTATISSTGSNYTLKAQDLQPAQVVSVKINLPAPANQVTAAVAPAVSEEKPGFLQKLTRPDHNLQVFLWIVGIVGSILLLTALVKSQSNCSCRCGPVCSCSCGCRKGCPCQSTSFKEEPVNTRRSGSGSGYNSYSNNDPYYYNDDYDSGWSSSSSSSSSWSSSDSSSSSSDSGGSGDSGGGDSW
ncbi:MAG TPA: DUF2207 domain-containing protein [Candidatus Obscuribacter sp.]|nr:DUF2207 domain-containing protein [Candidatus Obscuribacter sp.]